MIASSEQVLAQQLDSISSALLEWGSYVDQRIISLVEPVFANTNFMQVAPASRLKSPLSFIRKCLYRSKNNNYPNPLVDVEDKVATRIILLTTKNVEAVKGLITSNNEWDHRISKDTKQFSSENPNLFDYQSVHVIVWPKENRNGVDKMVLTCEIQIRTLLEHAYAEVTHDSVYKGAFQDNNDIKRQLSKCMALMETTDDMFCSVFEQTSLKADNSPNAFTQLLVQATHIYNGIAGSKVDFRNSDVYFIDAITYIFQIKPITVDLLRLYVGQREKDIRIAIETNRSILMHEPAVLILFCYIENFEDFLWREWPLSITIIDSMRESLGIAAGEY